MYKQMGTHMKVEDEGGEAMEPKHSGEDMVEALGQKAYDKVKGLVSQIEAIAGPKGVDVADLVSACCSGEGVEMEKSEGEDMEESEDMGPKKMAIIMALKKKNSDEEYA